MGRVIPERPPLMAHALTGNTFIERRKCEYCATFNTGTKCESCGAPVNWSPPRALGILELPLAYTRR